MIRVFIAEDQRMLLSALGTLLNMEEDIEIIGCASNGKEAIDSMKRLQPDISLIDIEMPVKNGLEVAEEIKSFQPACKVIILTTFARPGYFQRAVKIGVQGYLLKDGSIEELAAAIRAIMKGERVFSPELMLDIIREENPLTAREQEILSLAAEGKTTNELTQHLFLSSGTIRNYMSEIIQKLGAKNRIEAISIAKGKGWI
ncbi:response regulator transcription factor [Bacillus xiapuensis]|uniref:response regulator transcription factor n=1 Tax=Bacillus xiapuensis TaxID=2014075 RepID=UPI000C24B183|nr:response regulator transcription factor [Bacillus xiapuensis]